MARGGKSPQDYYTQTLPPLLPGNIRRRDQAKCHELEVKKKENEGESAAGERTRGKELLQASPHNLGCFYWRLPCEETDCTSCVSYERTKG